VPLVSENHVSRPRLLKMLARAQTTPLVVVSAPAGTGKSSLVAEWTDTFRSTEDVAWATFETDDEALWPTLVASLGHTGLVAEQETFPRGATSVDPEVLTSLAGAVARLPRRVTLVLDGYEMTSSQVAADVDFLLRHSGHRLRLVLTTRADPVLPLYRYRLLDTVTDVRMADLAFTDEEASQLLTGCSVSLREPSLRALNSRLHGWAVGLRFAARVLAARDDPDLAVAEVVGDRGNIGEYLMGEVLNVQPPELRAVLLSTSVPDVLRPGLADALAGQSTARALDLLTRANAFIEAVPDQPGCFRYPPFFRDLLRAELAYESPDLMRRLQRKAAEWFADQGLVEESVTHYVAIDSWADAAAEVVDSLSVGELVVKPSSSPLAKALQAIPDRLEDSSVQLVRAALALGAADRVVPWEQLQVELRPSGSGNSRHHRALAQSTAVLQAVGGRYDPDIDADQALALAGQAEAALQAPDSRDKLADHPELIGLVQGAKGAARERQGRLTGAHDAFEAAARSASEAGAEPLLLESLSHMAVLDCYLGNIRRAESSATRAMTLAHSADLDPTVGSEAAATALAWVEIARNDVVHAAKRVRAMEAAGAASDDPALTTLQAMVRARIRVAEGDTAGALACLETVPGRVSEAWSWLIVRVRIERGRVRVLAGDADGALAEVEGIEASIEPDVAVVVARAKLLQGNDAATAGALVPALARATPLPTQIEGWLVEAARQMHGGSPARARSALGNSLRLARDTRTRLPFLEADSTVRQLLASDRRLSAANPWLSRAPGSGVPTSFVEAAAPTGAHVDEQAAVSVVVETLTQKELEVLGHLAELLTTEEIASSMFVSVNTIRTHVRSILRKLGVSRRNAAVRRARELELLSA
jgi:LuxR family transcriptional regulator, maltose regulon positive regulatory protein